MTRSLATLLLLLVSVTDVVAAAGDLDPSFGTGGAVRIGDQRYGAGADDVKVLPDGRILVAAGNRVHRLLPSGALDPTFGKRGTAQRLTLDADVLAVQPDGKILVGGMRHGRRVLSIGRLTENGRRDRDFGRNGVVSIPERGYDFVRNIVVDDQARILFLGLVLADGGIVRLLPDGSRDTTFGTNGVVVEKQLFGSGFTSLAVQQDGKILVTSGGSIVRLTNEGARDTTFGFMNSGTIALGYPGWGHRSVALFPLDDGKVLTAGTVVPWPYANYGGASFGRMLPDGTSDAFFGINGYVRVQLGDVSLGEAAARMPDGRIVVAGYGRPDLMPEEGPDEDYLLAMFHPDGTLDHAFGQEGVLSGDVLGVSMGHQMSDRALGVAVQSDGAIVVALTIYDQFRTAENDPPVWGYVVRHLGN